MERRPTDAEPLATIFVAAEPLGPRRRPLCNRHCLHDPQRSDICPFVAIWASLIRKEPRSGLLAPALIPA